MRQFFRAVDEAIGRLTGFFGDQATYYVVSDHGFGPLLAECHLNYFLAERGFLTLKTPTLATSRNRRGLLNGLAAGLRAVRLAGPIAKVLRKVAPRLADYVIKARQVFAPESMVDWSRTRALVLSNYECGLRINLRGRYPQGIVQPGEECQKLVKELLAALADLDNPISGGKLQVNGAPREQILSGPYVNNAPDLFIGLGDLRVGYSSNPTPPLFAKGRWSGTHRMEGVLVAAGPGIRPGGRVNAHITDVAPMVLHAMGLAIPPHIEGRVRPELFVPQWLTRRPIQVAAEPAAQAVLDSRAEAARHPLSPADQKTVIDQLKRLGYM